MASMPTLPARTVPRWADPHPAFAYSDSRYRRYRQCRVAYFMHTYGSWRGWEAAPDTTAWLAYRCKKATPLAALIGTVIHEAMATCVRALAARQPMPTFDRLRAAAASTLNEAWTSSRRRRRDFLARPSRVAAPMLLEMLYGVEPDAWSLAQYRQQLDLAIQALLECDELWEDVRRADPRDVMLVDPFFSFQLPADGMNNTVEALHVYAAPDVLVRPHRNAPWVITDVKSGRTDGVIDQLLTYAVAARDGLGLTVECGYVGQVIALGERPTDRVTRFTISPDEIDQAIGQLRRNAAELASMAADPMTNAPVPLNSIPRSRNEQHCRRCAYRAVCWPDRHPIRAD